jgi:hypothetical protein
MPLCNFMPPDIPSSADSTRFVNWWFCDLPYLTAPLKFWGNFVADRKPGLQVTTLSAYRLLDWGGSRMTSYRWTTHRLYEGPGKDYSGDAPISLWRIARCAAEETLQGSPLASAWLKLFRTQLSGGDKYWLRWSGDFAESAELRRAYSGLYGRFFARALLSHHLGHSRFVSLKRNGVTIPGSVSVNRSMKGDIPDWIAWDDASSRFVLCEAKGSLTAKDFLVKGGPQCVLEGKKQFTRVEVIDGTTVVKPLKWVAATRWATEARKGNPITVLWDPPTDGEPFSAADASRHRKAITMAWLDSIAPGLGWSRGDELISNDRAREALIVRASPGPMPEDKDWTPPIGGDGSSQISSGMTSIGVSSQVSDEPVLPRLETSDVYAGTQLLAPPKPEKSPLKRGFLAAIVTRFGVRPVRYAGDFEFLQREQERARNLEEPAMLVGIPLNLDPGRRPTRDAWIDGAGISAVGDLAVFDLRQVEVERMSSAPTV